jgi:2-phosphosulfolactate phosphatase
MSPNSFFDQSAYDLRCEWGLGGIEQLAASSDALIVVDIFSFTTSVDVALARGACVYPYRWKDDSILELARALGAIPAVAGRRDPHGFSLAPSSMLHVPPGTKLVLPSPNGATLSLATGATPTFAACLRNARSVARQAAALGPRISLIPAGERWLDGSLRPALEDWLGAGAVLRELAGSRSSEADAAVAVFERFRERLLETLAACGSGREAGERGSALDLRLAAEWNASQAVPRLAADEAHPGQQVYVNSA